MQKDKIATLGIKTQQLIAKCYDLHLLEEAELFRQVDAELWNIYQQLKANFDPDQPRVPAGSPDGGQWVSIEGGEETDPSIYEYDPPIEPVYPIISTILFFLPVGALRNAWRAWSVYRDAKPEWKLGTYKSPQRWANQLAKRDWTPEQISDTINHGKKFPAPNKVNPGNKAVRYQTEIPGRYVVRDEVTKEILQVGKEGFDPPIHK